MAVLIARIEATADDSFAAMRARSRFGMAIAAMIKMIATTISSSISEKPFCCRILMILPVARYFAAPEYLFHHGPAEAPSYQGQTGSFGRNQATFDYNSRTAWR